MFPKMFSIIYLDTPPPNVWTFKLASQRKSEPSLIRLKASEYLKEARTSKNVL